MPPRAPSPQQALSQHSKSSKMSSKQRKQQQQQQQQMQGDNLRNLEQLEQKVLRQKMIRQQQQLQQQRFMNQQHHHQQQYDQYPSIPPQDQPVFALPAPPNARSSSKGRSSSKPRKSSSRGKDRDRDRDEGREKEYKRRESSRSKSRGTGKSKSKSDGTSKSKSRSSGTSHGNHGPREKGSSRNHKDNRGSALDSTISTNTSGMGSNPPPPPPPRNSSRHRSGDHRNTRSNHREVSPPKYPNAAPRTTTNNDNNGTTVRKFLSQQRNLQNQQTVQSQNPSSNQYKSYRQDVMVREIEAATGGEIITRRMTEISEAVSELGDSYQTLETTLNKHGRNGGNAHVIGGGGGVGGSNNDAGNNNNQLVTKKKNPTSSSSSRPSPVVDTVPADHPSSNIIQTHRTCTLCHRDLPRSQFSTQDRYTIHLSLAPGAVCRTCSMTVSAVRLKCMPSMERLLVEYGERGGELVEANARFRAQQQGLLEGAAGGVGNNASALVLSRRGSGESGGIGPGSGNYHVTTTGRELVPVGVQSVYSGGGNTASNSAGAPPVTNINGVFSSNGTSNYLAQEDRPTHIADCKYIDMLFTMPCYPRLNSLGLFASSRDVSVSLAALEAVRLYGTLDPGCFVGHDQFGERMDSRHHNAQQQQQNQQQSKYKNFNHRSSMGTIGTNLTGSSSNLQNPNGTNINPKSIVCLVIGEGRSPRTAILASQHYGWTTLSIDPNLSEEWDGYHHDTLPGYTGYSASISEFMDNSEEHTETMIEYSNPNNESVEHLVIIAVQMNHDQVRLTKNASINDIRARYKDVPTTLVSMSPVRKATLAPKRRVGQASSALERDVGYEPNCSYIDEGVFSACRFVEVWNFHNAEDDDEDYEDGSYYSGSEEYTEEYSRSDAYSGTYDDEENYHDHGDSFYSQGEGTEGSATASDFQSQGQESYPGREDSTYGEESQHSREMGDGRSRDEKHGDQYDNRREEDNNRYYSKGESWYDRDEEQHENHPPALPPSQHGGDSYDGNNYQDNSYQEGLLTQYKGQDEEEIDRHEQTEDNSSPSSRHSRRSRSRTKSQSQKERIAKKSNSQSRARRRRSGSGDGDGSVFGSESDGSGTGSGSSYDTRSYTEEGDDSRGLADSAAWSQGDGGSSYADGQDSRDRDHHSQYSEGGSSFYGNSLRNEQESSVYSEVNSERERGSPSRGGRGKRDDSIKDNPYVVSSTKNPFNDGSEDQLGNDKNQNKNPFDDDSAAQHHDDHSYTDSNSQYEDQHDHPLNEQQNKGVWEKAMAKHEEQDAFCNQFEKYYSEQDQHSCPSTGSETSFRVEKQKQQAPEKATAHNDSTQDNMSGSESFYVYDDDDQSENSGLAALNRWNNNVLDQAASGGDNDDEEDHLAGWSDDEYEDDGLGQPGPSVRAKQRPWANSAGDGVHGDSFYSYGDGS